MRHLRAAWPRAVAAAIVALALASASNSIAVPASRRNRPSAPAVVDVDYRLEPGGAGRLAGVRVQLAEPASSAALRLRPEGRRFRCVPVTNRLWTCDTDGFKVNRVTAVSVSPR